MSTLENRNLKKKQASLYSNAIVGTGYLAYRDLKALIDSYVTGKNALDYGCGRGRSSHFLSSLNFSVEAVDICPYMVSSLQHSSMIHYRLIQPFQEDFIAKPFDLILSQLVLVEIGSPEKIKAMLLEQYSALKTGGILIHTTASEALLKNQWQSIDTEYWQNKNIKNGGAGKVKLLNRDLELTSFHWCESYLKAQFKEAGFELLTLHQPLGKREDPYHWITENRLSPYFIFVLKKV